MTDEKKPKIGSGQINFNTFLSIIALGIMGWIGNTTVKMLQDVTEIKVSNAAKYQQLDRLEARMTAQEDVIRKIQVDMGMIVRKQP